MKILKRVVGLVLVVAAFIGGWTMRGTFLGGGKAAPRTTAAPAPVPVLLDGVPDVRQSTPYSCGASALQAVLHYYGIESREDSLMRECRTTEKDGTRPEDILRVAQKHGLRAVMKEGLSLNDLEIALWEKIPVIAAIQAWTAETGPKFSWAKAWENGHYVIVLGMDDKNIYVEDPSLLGSRGMLPRREFLDRWHDYQGKPPFDAADRAYVRMGIFIEGPKAEKPVPFRRIE